DQATHAVSQEKQRSRLVLHTHPFDVTPQIVAHRLKALEIAQQLAPALAVPTMIQRIDRVSLLDKILGNVPVAPTVLAVAMRDDNRALRVAVGPPVLRKQVEAVACLEKMGLLLHKRFFSRTTP